MIKPTRLKSYHNFVVPVHPEPCPDIAQTFPSSSSPAAEFLLEDLLQLALFLLLFLLPFVALGVSLVAKTWKMKVYFFKSIVMGGNGSAYLLSWTAAAAAAAPLLGGLPPLLEAATSNRDS